MKLNRSQQEAARHRDGPMLVLAGPGSGKTTVITERTRTLVLEYAIPPEQILVITFTKAAAQEMKLRFQNRMQGGAAGVTFGTFHAVYFSILKHAYHYTADNIIREEQKYQFLREIISKYRLEYEDENEFLTAVLGEIGMVKNTGVEIANYYSKNCAEHTFRKIFLEYQERLYRGRFLDFDDMLVYTYELFRERKDILLAWQRKFRYILIDEFQDINKVQFDVIKLLAGETKNLFVVGDDDQSIYRFRGAKPEIMLRFRDSFPDAKQVLLDTNYRSNACIVAESLRLIGHNRERYEKAIVAAQPKGEPVEYGVFSDQRKQNLRIIRDMQTVTERGGKFSDFAVLFRTNTQPRLLMEQLMEYNIPFRTKDNIPNLYEHWIAKDILAYLRIAQGSSARSDFLQIINRPKRYISRSVLDSDTVNLDVLEWYYEEQPWMRKRVEQLAQDIKRLTRMSPFAAIHYIRKGIGYDEFCEEYADYRRMKVEDLYDVLDELQESAREYPTCEEWFDHMDAYAKELEQMRRQMAENSDSVLLATLHSAKGLEFEHVYLVDVNEGIMPYKKAVLEYELEEERRMFYVGMTRAKRNLHLFSVRQLNNKDAEISRFVREARGDKEGSAL